MMRTFLLTEEEVQIIEAKTGIKLTEKPEKSQFWDYAFGEIDTAVSMLDEHDFSKEVLEELRGKIDEMTQTFIDGYICQGDEDGDSRFVTDAFDEIFDVIVQWVDETACEIRDGYED